MSISEPLLRSASAPQRPDQEANPHKRQPPLARALNRLAEAIAQEHTEPICVGYLLLRRAAAGMSVRAMLDAADLATGGGARLAIVSAFGRRHCFMCRTGSYQCKACDGTGVADRALCGQCDGLGAEACDFCRGAGWSDVNETPAELRPAVARWRLAQLEKDLERLGRLPSPQSLQRMHVTPKERRELAGWLIRLRSRLAIPPETEADNGKQHAERFATAIEKAEHMLDAIRPGRHR